MLDSMPKRVRALTGLLLGSIVLGWFLCCWLLQVVIQTQAEASLEHQAASVHATLAHELDRAHALAELVAREPLAQQLVAARDTQGLIDRFGPEFATLAQNQGVRQFQFHQPPATSLARIHRPEAFGDDLSGFRNTVVQANRTGRPVVGLERGAAGLGLRAIEPVVHDGRRVGSVEIGLALDPAMLERVSGDTPIALYVEPAEGGEAQRQAATTTDEAALALLDAATGGDVEQGMWGERRMGLVAVPVTSFDGGRVGTVVASFDLSAHYALRNTGWWVISGVAFMVMLMVFAVGLVANRKARAAGAHLESTTFDRRLGRALRMARDETDATAVMARALKTLAPDRAAHLLLADNSNAHLDPVLVLGESRGCRPPTPRACPAAASGHGQYFPSADALDACPHLVASGTGCGASCHPVAVAGAAVGVLHVQHVRQPGQTELRRRLGQLTERFGDKLTIVRAMAESETAARTDPLTGLLNRRSFRATVVQHLDARKPYVVAFADLDHFKRLNDTYGHDVGDRALRRFATLLARVVEDRGLICRQGGEEFVLFLPDYDAATAAALCDDVRVALAQAVTTGADPSFTVSMGVAASNLVVQPYDMDGFDAIVTLADEALLAAKEAGRDRVIQASPSLRQVA